MIHQIFTVSTYDHFLKNGANAAIALYDKTQPITDPKNMALIIATPIAAIAGLSLSTRAAAGAGALSARLIGTAADITSKIANIINEKVEKTANKLESFASRSTLPEVILSGFLMTTTAAGIGLYVLANLQQEQKPPIQIKYRDVCPCPNNFFQDLFGSFEVR